MKNFTFIIILLLVIVVSACGSEPYSYDTAMENGDVVDLHGNVKNAERLEAFYQNSLTKTEDKIRITRFMIEGDPIFYDLVFNGAEVQFKYDNSKDKHGTTNIRTASCKTLTFNTVENGKEYELQGCYGKNKELGDGFKFEVRN